jgi:hypothetical protein
VEIDFDKVRRERERGLRGLGQPLKSFRDRRCEFAVYQRDSGLDSYLYQLGPLANRKTTTTPNYPAPAARFPPPQPRHEQPPQDQ